MLPFDLVIEGREHFFKGHCSFCCKLYDRPKSKFPPPCWFRLDRCFLYCKYRLLSRFCDIQLRNKQLFFYG